MALWHGYGPVHDKDRDVDGPLLGSWHDGESEDWVDDEDDRPQPRKPAVNAARKGRLHNALAIVCHATAWWLRRALGSCSTLAAFGVGVICTGAAYVVGAGLASSVLGLMALVEAVNSGTSLLSFLSL